MIPRSECVATTQDLKISQQEREATRRVQHTERMALTQVGRLRRLYSRRMGGCWAVAILQKQLNATDKLATSRVAFMSTAAAPQPSTARTLLHDTFHRSRLAIGDPVLDQALDGLDVAGGLTEIAGEAGTGTTRPPISNCIASRSSMRG